MQVGPFSDIKEAEGARGKLVSDGYNPILKKYAKVGSRAFRSNPSLDYDANYRSELAALVFNLC